VKATSADVARYYDANTASFLGRGQGGGHGAIHRAGGRAIIEETNRKYPEGCPTGAAVISGGGKLPAKFVIHAVGPVWSGGERGEASWLAGAYQTSLELATEYDCQSVALPALSTGAYRYPLEEAARVAITTAADYLRGLEGDSPPRTVRFVLFSDDVLGVFERALEAVSDAGG